MAKVFTITEGLENMGALRTGGQGSVYKGKRMGAIISAVKLLPTPIHTENADDKNFRDFQNEVEKLKKVNEDPSPNVVKILHSGLTESGSLPFIEMEYIEGPDLEDLLKPPHNSIFNIREVLKLAEQLANALAHCHKVGVKHGDIKSNNIKFNTATGNYILLDFGLAVMSDEQRRSSLRNAGAVEFMAPEQYDGKMLFQTDVYSYGVVLYELLAGSVPFPLLNKHESARNSVMLAHIEKEVPDILTLRYTHLPSAWSEVQRVHEMDVPVWLLQVISKCLKKVPEDRFADGMTLHDAICTGLASSSGNNANTTLINNLEAENARLQAALKKYEPIQKLKWLIAGAAILLICLSAFGINAIFTGGESTKSDSSSVVKSHKPADSVKNNSNAVPANTPAGAARPADKTVPDPNKKTKTKDGLVDDVPYF